MSSNNVVLVHGGFVDGSGWQGVYNVLAKQGFTVSIVQNPTLSLEGDVAATKFVLDAQDAPPAVSSSSEPMRNSTIRKPQNLWDRRLPGNAAPV